MSEIKFETKADYWKRGALEPEVRKITIEKEGDEVTVNKQKVARMIWNGIQLRFEMKDGGTYIIFKSHQPPMPRKEMFITLGGKIELTSKSSKKKKGKKRRR